MNPNPTMPMRMGRSLTVRHAACNKQSMSTPANPPEPVPAAAVILLRDGAGGLEVLMQRRREQATAFAGVVAFPGGKVAPIDSDPAFAAAADLGAPEPFPHARQLAAL